MAACGGGGKGKTEVVCLPAFRRRKSSLEIVNLVERHRCAGTGCGNGDGVRLKESVKVFVGSRTALCAAAPDTPLLRLHLGTSSS